MLDRTIQPRICEPEQLAVPSPECRVMKNGIPLYILNAGDNEVVRIDLLIEGGRWQQSQRLQALFTNRMLREGTRRYSAAALPKSWITMVPGWSFPARPSMLISPFIL